MSHNKKEKEMPEDTLKEKEEQITSKDTFKEKETKKKETSKQDKERKMTIGSFIRETRLNKNITLSKISKDTRIRHKYLESIEKDLFSVIPGEVAIKGFLNIYAAYLGLDVTLIIDQYNKENIEIKPKKEIVDYEEKPKHFRWYIFVALIVIFVFFFFYFKGTTKDNSLVGDNLKKEVLLADDFLSSLTIPTVDNKILLPEKEPVAKKKRRQVKKIVKLNIKAVENSWVRVLVDSKQVFHGMINRGETRAWYGKEKIYIKSPEPAYLHLVYNDMDVGFLSTNNNKIIDKEFLAKPIN